MNVFCFFINEQEMGVKIEHVIETNAIEMFTILPNAPKYIIGLVNMRGNIIPLISLIKFFNIRGRDYLKKAVYFNHNNIQFGVTINGLSKPIKIADKDILPYPRNINENIREYFSGVVHLGDRNIQILDIENLIKSIKAQDSEQL